MAKKEAKVQAAEVKEAAVKKTTRTRKTAAGKAAKEVTVNAENIGFRAGDVYQALAAAETALSVKEIAKKAGISEEETLLGLGWLFKEGKLNSADDNKVALA